MKLFTCFSYLRRGIMLLLSAHLFFLSGCGNAGNDTGDTPVPTHKIGVILPLSGEENFDARQLLSWAAGEINAAGSVAGGSIELEFADPVSEGLDQAAARLANDPKVLAVIGPANSGEFDAVAARFIRKKKVIVSPSSTSEDIFKSYGGRKFIWRTVEADSAQMETMVSLADAGGATTAALVTSRNIYGLTFYHWFGFLSAEAGLTPVGSVTYPADDRACEPYVDEATAAKPDVLFAVALHTEQVACMLRRTRSVSPGTRVIFSDGAFMPEILGALGRDAEGMEGIAPTADPQSGFAATYTSRFQKSPPPFAANTWDALLLITYALARSQGVGGEVLADSLIAVVDGRGENVSWDRNGITAGLKAIESDLMPDISGASGPLDYDEEFHTDPVSTYYAHWAVEGGTFVTRAVYISGTTRSDVVASIRQSASDILLTTFSGTGSQGPAAPRKDLWALIVAGSQGWGNYRHQADALAQYRHLRQNGVPDDRIVLVLADDIAYNPLNPRLGEVQYIQGGQNLYVDVVVDYSLQGITASDLMDILSGKASAKFPVVITSTADDNIYVFLSGHGSQSGFLVGASDSFDSVNGTVLTPSILTSTFDGMAAASAYRQMLVVVESCHSGTLGAALKTPNILMLTAASPYENSLAHNRRLEDGTWLADQFAYQFWRAVNEDPSISLAHVYTWTYQRVSGSHVSIYNSEKFMGFQTANLAGFMSYSAQ